MKYYEFIKYYNIKNLLNIIICQKLILNVN